MTLPNLAEALKLTTEQQFQLRTCEIDSQSTQQPHLRAMVIELVRQQMIKDNVIRLLMKEVAK